METRVCWKCGARGTMTDRCSTCGAPLERPETPADTSDPVAQIERLAKLRSDGLLSADEFKQQKARVLGTENIHAKDKATPPTNAVSSASRSGFRSLFTALIIAAAIAYGYPLLNEDASNACSAFEKKVLRIAAGQNAQQSETNASQAVIGTLFLGALQKNSNGAFAESLVRQKYPNIPPLLGCVLAYYQEGANTFASQSPTALQAPTSTAPQTDPGYNANERKDLDRLLQGSQ